MDRVPGWGSRGAIGVNLRCCIIDSLLLISFWIECTVALTVRWLYSRTGEVTVTCVTCGDRSSVTTGEVLETRSRLPLGRGRVVVSRRWRRAVLPPVYGQVRALALAVVAIANGDVSDANGRAVPRFFLAS